MVGENEFASLLESLKKPEQVILHTVRSFSRCQYRTPEDVDAAVLSSLLLPLVQALACAVSPDRNGYCAPLVFRPGQPELREVEQAIVFLASNAGTRFTREASPCSSGFDIGALLFSLRDVLIAGLETQARDSLQGYWEWLVVLAGDSMANSRVQSARERFLIEMDEGTPLLMITPELPAAIFVCSPNKAVIEGVLSRLLLTIVRTGAKAAILDLRGLTKEARSQLLQSAQALFEHPRVSAIVTLFLCGVDHADLPHWEEMAKSTGVHLNFESYFDICVTSAMKCAGWRILKPNS